MSGGPRALLRAAAAGLCLALAVSALAGPPDPGRRGALLYLLRQDCGSCHGLTLKGGLGPPLLPSSLEGKPDEALVETILDGRPGTPMPPWGFEISPDEAAWMVEQLKAGVPQ
jgi:cytochrome c55X